MFKRGGNTKSASPNGKSGMERRYKCKVCSRGYATEHTCYVHERLCEQYLKAHGK